MRINIHEVIIALDKPVRILLESCYMNQLITYEDFTSIQELQAGATRLFLAAAKKNKFYRVMRNKIPLGVLIPNNLWDSLLEDFEAMSSPRYLKRIALARKSKNFISSAEAKKRLGIK